MLVKVLEKLVMKDREVARRYGMELAGGTGSANSSIASEPMESIGSDDDEDGDGEHVSIHATNVTGSQSPTRKKSKKALTG